MAIEKFIKGKKDEARHEGRASTVRRQQETLNQLKDLDLGQLEELGDFLGLPNRRQFEDYASRVEIPKGNGV